MGLAVTVFVLAFAVYYATLTPGLSHASFDGVELVTLAYRLGLSHPTGSPLYTWLGKLFTFIPVGDVAYRVNLLSAVGAAGSASLLYGILFVLTKHRVASLFGSLLWAFSTTLWSQAVIAELYAPNALMLALTLLLAIAWADQHKHQDERSPGVRAADLLFLAVWPAYGLSLGIHLSNLAFAPGLVLFVIAVDRRVLNRTKLVAAGSGLLALALLQFLWLPLRATHGVDPLLFPPPTTAEGFLNYTLNAFDYLRWAIPIEELSGRIEMYLGFVRDNFAVAGMLLALVGAVELARTKRAVFLLLGTGYFIEVIYFLEYDVFDPNAFFIPAHLVVAICAGFGAWRLLVFVELAARLVTSNPVLPAGAAALASIALFAFIGITGRDGFRANDNSGDTLVNDFYGAVFDTVPDGSVLIAARTPLASDLLYFREVEGRRPDLVMPFLPNAEGDNGDDRPLRVFTTWRAMSALGGIQAEIQLFEAGTWFVPLVSTPTNERWLNSGGELALYEVVRAPPVGMLLPRGAPQSRLDASLLSLWLEGVDLPEGDVPPGGLAHIRLYWRVTGPEPYVVTTHLSGSEFEESHRLLFGNLHSYLERYGAPLEFDWHLVEEYDLLIPSSHPTGNHTLTVTVSPLASEDDPETASVDVGQIQVR